MRKDELKQNYLDTTYSIFIEGKQYDIKIDKPLPQVIQELVNKEKSAVILTACNPRSKILSSQVNKSKNNQLNLDLKNYTVFNAVGLGEDLTWPAEASFFILGVDKEEAGKLAVQYEQNAYVWCEKDKTASLVFTEVWKNSL